ncbi:MAG: heat-inducible transcriptional repressor HrcA [Candidatus Enteromonas sp.]|nr:heat-inducible transcriptional repressor HrcA [bacterium]MDD6917585.1 heat-inducible transcriptional repressor HrcA [bacterium]MDY6100269.1 heat-inducible transcriptional repressor HrcA [Candidatus Enteromonas sp.]
MTRSEEILKLIVEHFIRTGEPVGSKTLLETYHLGVSSATIRAEMSQMEKEGLLEKPHASAGRVPSSKGYEYYVEHLREERIDSSVKYAIQTVLEKKAQSVEEVISRSCEILSNMTNLAVGVLGPKVNNEKLISIQLIPIGPNTATAVFVTDQGYVENKTFVIEEAMTPSDVQKTMELLSNRLVGTPISELVPKMEAMKPAVTDYLVGQDAIYQALLSAFVQFAGERVNLYGKENLLDHPEFAEDAKKLKKILRLLDHPEDMRKALEGGSNEQGIKVQFGKEKEGLQDMALISADIQVPGQEKTSISLVGPTRMDYERIMSTLKYVTKSLDDYFAGRGAKKGAEQACRKKTSNPGQSPSKTKKSSQSPKKK